MLNGFRYSIKERQNSVIKISDPILVNELVNNHYQLIDDYLTVPMNNILYLEDNKIMNKQVGVTTSIFNDLLDVINFINESIKNNFFMLYEINKNADKKVIIRYINIPLHYNLLGKKQIRTQRLRDKKIEEVLNG